MSDVLTGSAALANQTGRVVSKMDQSGDGADRRTQLLEILSAAALRETSSPISLRKFAIEAGVSEPTLRHYFDDRQGLVIAILRFLSASAGEYLERCADGGPDLPKSISDYLALAMEGVENDVFARTHAFALVESIHDPMVAEVYLQTAIEPSLAAIERRLAASMDQGGQGGAADPEFIRDMAFFLYSPMLAAILHQRLLCGEKVRPLDLQRFFGRLTRVLSQSAQAAK